MKKGQILMFTELFLAVIGVIFLILLLVFLEFGSILEEIPGVETRPQKEITVEEMIKAPRKVATGANSFLSLSTSQGPVRDVLRNYFIHSDKRGGYKDILEEKLKELFAQRVEMRIGRESISNGAEAFGEKTIVSRAIALPEGGTKKVTFRIWYLKTAYEECFSVDYSPKSCEDWCKDEKGPGWECSNDIDCYDNQPAKRQYPETAGVSYEGKGCGASDGSLVRCGCKKTG